MTIEFTQPFTDADTLQRVSVELAQSLQTNLDNLEFVWMRNYVRDGVRIKDTIRTKGYMDVVLPKGQSTTYNVMLQIKDKTTDLSHYSEFVVATRPIFKNSIFVLHGTPGNMKLGNVEKVGADVNVRTDARSEEHTSELQSRQYLVCRLLLEKKKKSDHLPQTDTQLHISHKLKVTSKHT